MIPKKIHYCWFSGDPFSESIQRCIDSWHKFLPDFEWVKWDYAKAKALEISWVNKALAQKKWAFAADAVRLYALYTEGGLYLDTDVEILRSFEPMLNQSYILGYENGSDRIEAATMGCEAGFSPIKVALDFYKNQEFNYSENLVDQMVLPNILRESFKDFKDLKILPESAFSPKSFIDGKIRTTKDSYCIHHFSSSWRPESVQKGIARRQMLFAKFPRPVAKALSIPLALWTNLQTLGIFGTLQKFKALFKQPKN
ncbi:MAG: glycosyl transferase [Fibrobacter sp.]|nr:glycosyl transferase [Fibrobacter sp.]